MKKVCKCGKVIEYNHTCSCQSRYDYKKEYMKKRGDSEKMLYTKRWKDKKEYIKERDNYTCQRCFHKYGIINNEDLQVHHIKPRIKYPELAYEDSNLICICGTCNRQLNIQEELDFEWTPPEVINNFTL